ncbi:protein-tyrosine phosphatase [Rhodococcus sp. LBL1]|nr:protein-tyrosine phosphatase [Rhodococcus sp. LBL1]MDH6683450.1 protein-tyrosine phosphatase [Rhodococcus sp. LBL2]
MTTILPPHTTTRRLVLPGTYNLRDIGGYTAGERTTRWRKLLRSDALHTIEQDGRDTLTEIGLGLVIDLREDDEISKAPNALDGVGHREVHVPVYNGKLDHNPTAATFDLGTLYQWMLADHGSRLTDAVRLIAGSGDEPVLVHCTAGKDRTGLVIALALSAVGVGARDVVADYSLSETLLHGEWVDAMVASFRERELPEGFDIEGIVAASPAAVMRATLAGIDAEHGGVRPYLLDHGMSEAELTDLHAALLG